MTDNFRVASARIRKEVLDEYDRILASDGLTRHTDLKRYIEERVNESRKRSELGKTPESPRRERDQTNESNSRPDPVANDGWFW